MAAIKEDYVSFEIAKLLKEKGFDEGCSFVVNAISKGVMPVSWPTTNSDIEDEKASLIALPTLQMAMKWLREVHKLVITVSIGNENNKGNTDYSNPDRWFYFFDITNEKGVVIDTEYDPLSNEFPTYEEACEAAIKYCLEHLI